MLGHLGQLRYVLQRLAQRGGGKRELTVDFQLGADGALALFLVRRRRVGSLLRRDVVGVLQFRPGRQAVRLDDAGIARLGLHAECLAHRACDDLQLLLVLVGKSDEHHEEAQHQPHQVGEGHEPAVPSAMCIAALLLGHWLLSGPPLPADQAGTGSPSSSRCFSGR